MSNSPLATYTKLSPNNSGTRTHAIDRITPHCVVGQTSVEALGAWFAQPSTQASCNYCIGADSRVGLIVDESMRSWCSSNRENDQRAVTIECASDLTAPYAFKDSVYAQLIALCADICKRNGKTKLIWIPDKSQALAYEPQQSEMVLTVHRWFANKSCPGDWLMARMSELASRVTEALKGDDEELAQLEALQREIETLQTEIKLLRAKLEVSTAYEAWLGHMDAYRKSLSDNDSSDWSAEAREWATRNGIITGTGNGQYAWEDFVTREQMAVMMYREKGLLD